MTIEHLAHNVNHMSSQLDLTEFIIEQLTSKGVRVVGVGAGDGDVKAYCFRGHDRKTPSLGFRRTDGAFYCFGCGVHGANWNALKLFLDIDTISEQDLPDDAAQLRAKIARQDKALLLEMALPHGVDPWSGSYRRVHEETLDAVGAGKWFDDFVKCFRIMLPIKMYGNLVGWTARRLDVAPPGKKLNMPYRNAPNMAAKKVLYPFDLVATMVKNTVVLVEGPYDALRLVNYGIPALSILGVKNFSSRKIGQISSLGVGKVIVAMDGDPAGDEARIDIALQLREMFDVEHFVPPRKRDPGNMPIECVEMLNDMVVS